MFFKVGVLKNFVILTGRYLCWTLFLTKLHTIGLFSCKYCKIVRNSFFNRTSPVAAIVSLIKSLVQYWASADLLFLIKNIVWDGFY